FGVVPQLSASKLARLWGPVLKYLGIKLGYKLVFRTAPTIPEFEQRCAEGVYDIAYMNPYHYVRFHEDPGYVAFARQSNKKLRGILVTRADSPVRSLEDLDGTTLAFPAPRAFAASILVRAELRRQRISFAPKYVSSHDSVYRAVAKGIYPAGGGIQRTFDNVDPKIRDQLRVAWTSQPFTPHAIAAHPRVPEAVVARLRQGMLAMASDPAGKKLLARLRFAGVEAGADSDWDDIRALSREPLSSLNRR
ncbi:MAG: phosphate/phosphite/phosphonate ABC transporter substrate-binding protein, partial [Myxococcota bacterium]